jgi:hypothetical protein
MAESMKLDVPRVGAPMLNCRYAFNSSNVLMPVAVRRTDALIADNTGDPGNFAEIEPLPVLTNHSVIVPGLKAVITAPCLEAPLSRYWMALRADASPACSQRKCWTVLRCHGSCSGKSARIGVI